MKFINYFAWTLFAFLIALHTSEENHVRFLLFIVLEAGLAMFIAGYLPFLGGLPLAPNSFTSIFAQSDVFGGFLLLMFPASCVMFLLAKNRWDQFIFCSAAVFFGGAIFITFSRGAWISAALILVVIVLVLFLAQKKNAIKRFLFIIIAGMVIMIVFNKLYSVNGSLVKQLSIRAASIKKLDDSSVHARFSFWDGAVKMAIQYPFLGVGEGNFGKVFPKFQKEFYYYSRFPHNWYLQVASETGLLSLFALIWFLYYMVICNWKNICNENGTPLFAYKMAVLSSVTAALLHLFVDVESNFSTYSIVLFGELGLLLALTKPPTAESFENISFRVLPPSDFPVSTKTVSPGEITSASPKKFSKGNLTVFQSSPIANKLKIVCNLLICVVVFAGGLQLLNYWGESFMEKAKLADETGNFEKAKHLIAIAGKLTPFNGAVLESQGVYSAREFQTTKNIADIENAIRFQKKAIQSDKTQASYYVGLSHLFTAIPDRKTAMEKYKESLLTGLSIDPVNYPYFYAKTAELLFMEGKLDESRSWYIKLITLYPKDSLQMLAGFRRRDFLPYIVEAYTGIGKVYAAKQDMAGARKWFEEAIQFHGEPFAAQEVLAAKFYLGQLDIHDKKFDEAVLYFKEISKNKYFEIVARQYLAFIFLKMEKMQNAKDEISLILLEQPENIEALLLQGDIAKLEGNYKDAHAIWTKALLYSPDNKVILERIRSLTVVK